MLFNNQDWKLSVTDINLYENTVNLDGQLRIPLYSITDWHRSPISDSHPFDQPGT